MKYSVNTTELKKAMIDADIATITQLSDKTGVNRNTLADIVHGRSKPSTMVIEKLAEELALDSADVGRIFFNKELA